MLRKKHTRANRILTIYSQLIRGAPVEKKELAKSFNVNEKTIQRDLDDIRAYFYDNREDEGDKDILYSHDKRGYFLNNNNDMLIREDILAISKILLESRAFCRTELEHLINSILFQINGVQRKHIREIIGNELLGYVSPEHNSLLLKKIWDLSELIRNKERLQVTYIKADDKEVSREIEPVSIIFSEYYFYLIAYFDDFDSPTIFRVDRIKEYRTIGEKFYIPYLERFEDGEFRKRIQFMYPGRLMKIKFVLIGEKLEFVLDRLPTSKIVEQAGDRVVVEAEVYGKGIMMWLLSQGSKIKVLSPDNLVEQIKLEICKMQNFYKTCQLIKFLGGDYMRIKTPKFLFDRFNGYKNIEYELEWMLGYCDKKIFNENFYRNVSFKTGFVDFDVPEDIIKVLKNAIEKISFEDTDTTNIENIINILYLTLYIMGGTN